MDLLDTGQATPHSGRGRSSATRGGPLGDRASVVGVSPTDEHLHGALPWPSSQASKLMTHGKGRAPSGRLVEVAVRRTRPSQRCLGWGEKRGSPRRSPCRVYRVTDYRRSGSSSGASSSASSERSSDWSRAVGSILRLRGSPCEAASAPYSPVWHAAGHRSREERGGDGTAHATDGP